MQKEKKYSFSIRKKLVLDLSKQAEQLKKRLKNLQHNENMRIYKKRRLQS
ncbi:hypothetical protein [Salibacterium salarium]|nr:hypothetical protein [Salibacterium salarium]